jgi:nitroimidazol reductase NimA-like FMN-containing flavoprotein (pyridoxamine 5'-phosphate oxidase superfamily)
MVIEELTLQECHEELARADFVRLACSRENQPYVVLVHVAVDRGSVYSFSMPGQKIEWMRANPLVCLEIDRVHSATDWTSVLVFGRYEELRDSDDHAGRVYAHELLRRRALWWEPGGAASPNPDARGDRSPIFFRVGIERMTGRRVGPGSPSSAGA